MSGLKTIIPAAGIHTSFYPLSKSIAHEMLPLGSKPALQYSIEEAIGAGTTDITFIINKHKHSLFDYLEKESQEALLSPDKKIADAAKISHRIHKQATFNFISQSESNGTADAIFQARHLIEKEHFGVLFPDDLISGSNCLNQLIRIHQSERGSVVAVQEVPRSHVGSYGVIEIKKQLSPSLFQISGIVEKPQQTTAPSCLAVVGRFILSPKIFSVIEEMKLDNSSQTLDLSTAITRLTYKNEKIFAVKIQGKRFDLSTPLGWTKAVIGLALENPAYGHLIKEYIQNLDSADSFIYNPIKNIENPL